MKVNTEDHQEISYQYGIQSIPNVKMFHQGKVIGEFAGALPRHQIIQWLDEFLPSADKAAWAELHSQLSQANSVEAVELLENFLELNPNHTEARHTLARYLAFSDATRAKELLSDVKMSDPAYDLLEDIQSIHELGLISDTHDEFGVELINAGQELKKDRFEEAVKRIIEVVKKDKSVYNDLPRRSAIAIFRLLGSQHPVTKKYRRLFDMVLY